MILCMRRRRKSVGLVDHGNFQLSCELTLVRAGDVPSIGEAALMGDATAAGLWRAVEIV